VIAAAPRYRTVYRDDCHFILPDSDVGIAVAIEDGLYAPVARNLGTHGLAENAAQIDALINQARDNTLDVDALAGGAITVSNLGGFNIQQVFPLIIPGQSSILGVGRQQSVFRPDTNDAPILKRELALVLACDHRVFNGTDGARMLQAIVDLLEDPLLIIAQARR
jgi:pyruvate dehydrogenase E2 component (dihydrolipoamide acetyltransferase)